MGLFDRSYMRNSGNGGREQTPDDSGQSMLFTLIMINAVVFLSTLFMPPSMVDALMLSPAGIRQFRIYQLVSAGFLHTDFWHFLVNMWGLYLFGGLITPYLGGKRFLWLYLIGAVSGNLLFLLLNWDSGLSLLGASGAVFAVLVGAALFEPERRFIMFPLPLPVRTRTLAVCYIILEVLMMGRQDGIAHLAHLGGVLGGYLYLKLLFRSALPWDPFRRKIRPGETPRRFRVTPEPPPDLRNDGPVGSRELDTLLDKVSRQGINSLSEQELARLRQAREEMRGGRNP